MSEGGKRSSYWRLAGAIAVGLVGVIWVGLEKSFEGLIIVITSLATGLELLAARNERLRGPLLLVPFFAAFLGLLLIRQSSIWLVLTTASFIALLLVAIVPALWRSWRYRKTVSLVARRHREWLMSDRDWHRLIHVTEMAHVNEFRERLADALETTSTDYTKSQLAFILRCAVQHGPEGNWGYWARRNARNEQIRSVIEDAITIGHFRPRWRAAYILEHMPDAERARIKDALSEALEGSRQVEEIFNAFSGGGVEAHLEGLAHRTEEEYKDVSAKAGLVLNEIEHFGADIEGFRRERRRFLLDTKVTGADEG